MTVAIFSEFLNYLHPSVSEIERFCGLWTILLILYKLHHCQGFQKSCIFHQTAQVCTDSWTGGSEHFKQLWGSPCTDSSMPHGLRRGHQIENQCFADNTFHSSILATSRRVRAAANCFHECRCRRGLNPGSDSDVGCSVEEEDSVFHRDRLGRALRIPVSILMYLWTVSLLCDGNEDGRSTVEDKDWGECDPEPVLSFTEVHVAHRTTKFIVLRSQHWQA